MHFVLEELPIQWGVRLAFRLLQLQNKSVLIDFEEHSMPVFRITPDRLDELPQTTFEDVGIKERDDLQRLLREQIEVVSPETLVISEEFSDWEGSSRRIDLLGVDRSGNLVVIELKRTQSGEHMELQALRYAAMVSAMTFERAVEVFENHLRKLGNDGDAETLLLAFLGWSEGDEERFAQEVQVVLASADFSQELTTTVMWLIDYGLDIRCVRLRPYRNGDEILLDVQQVIPLPEAADYQVRLREKRVEERKSTSKNEELAWSFWTTFLAKSREATNLHANISPTRSNWISVTAGFSGLTYNCVLNKHRSYIELHIDRGDREENKRIFDVLHEQQQQIDAEFGGALEWDRQEKNRRSLVKYVVDEAGYSDESEWPEIQDKMLDAIIRMERVFQPRIDALRRGETTAPISHSSPSV